MTSEKRVTIVGQGYVGLPLAMAAVAVGYKVTGIDVSNVIVENLNQGKSHVEDVSDRDLQRALELDLYRSPHLAS
jgi:UDP-N-acetyl-D-mannosaminuronic acid dehydrogenase/UDP-N-acetyl-D-glucosamine dehydrogenase